jgi:hypothetical protein
VAGEWIKVRTNLWDDPRIGQLCELTDQGEAAVIGGLYWLWATADEHSADGLLQGMTIRTIDRKTGVPGLGKALVTIGWLTEGEHGVTVARFDEHNGASAKQRAQTAKRVSNHKANAKVTQAALPETGDAVTDALPREDKKEELKTPHTPQGGQPGEQDESPKRKAAISLQTFLAECKRAGEKPIPDGDPVFAYADKVGLPHEFLGLHWREFKDRYQAPDSKRYKAWRTVFLKSVKCNWLKLWWLNGDGQYVLTTAGQQAQRAHREAA